MQQEEIKKIATAYFASKEAEGTYSEIERAFQWLAKDFCIVPKSKLKNCYAIAHNIKLANTVSQHIVEDDYQQGVMDVLQSIFGKSLFEE